MTNDRRNPATSRGSSPVVAAGAGFFLTPFAVYILGTILFVRPPHSQSLGLIMTFYSLLAAFPGAFYWGMIALWMNRGRRRSREVAAAWVIYGALIFAVAKVAQLSFSP